MSTIPKAATKSQEQALTATPQQAQPLTIKGPRLPYHPAINDRFGVDASSWRALVDAIFPGAQETESVILALSYCKARKLDPFKRVVHIVPIYSRSLGRMVDTVWPGIGELRTTAARTGEFAGMDEVQHGPIHEEKVGNVPMTYPEWSQATVYRMVHGQRVPFVGPKVRWLETYATAKRDSDDPNEMWRNRPFGQIDKCAEAAALRLAFPEEIGSDYIPEEVERGSKPVVVQKVAEAIGSKSDRLAIGLGVATPLEVPAEVIEQPIEAVVVPEVEEPQPSAYDNLLAAIRKATEAELPGLQGDIATEPGLDSKQKTLLTVELKARADALKK
jgi:phage recombination protein Bet